MEETPKNPDVSVHVDPEINFFGLTNYRSQFRRFGIKLDDRRRHMYMVGKTGMGKTTILENMVLNDIYAGHGVGLVDPHGDFAEKIIDFIPPHRVNDIVYFNPADVDYPIGFNILESINPEYRHLVASGLMGVFKKIWPDVWSARMEYILNNTILALLDYPDTTLMGINRLLADDDYREKVVKNLKDPVVRSFWVDEFAKYEKLGNVNQAQSFKQEAEELRDEFESDQKRLMRRENRMQKRIEKEAHGFMYDEQRKSSCDTMFQKINNQRPLFKFVN
jgi:hypothetical protein